MLRTILLITRGVALDPRARRWAMTALLLGALAMIIAGTTFLAGVLAQGPMRTLIYWAVCGWLTLAAMLLAIWDMMLLRIAARRERKALEKRMLEKKPDEPK